MKFTSRTSAITLGAALVLTLFVNSLCATQPNTIAAYDDGELVYIIPGVNDNVVGVDQQAIAEEAANPIYFVGGYYGPLDDQGNPTWVNLQPPVLSIGLAESGYNPYWEVYYVEVPSDWFETDTDTVTDTDPDTDTEHGYYKSEDAIRNSGFTPVNQNLILLCQQVTE